MFDIENKRIRPKKNSHGQSAPLQLHFRNDVVTDGIENILRNIVFGNLASYPRPRRGVELAQEYTTDGTLLSTSLVVLRVAIHHVRSQFFTHQECLTHKITKITDPTHFTHLTNQISVIPIHETIKIFAL